MTNNETVVAMDKELRRRREGQRLEACCGEQCLPTGRQLSPISDMVQTPVKRRRLESSLILSLDEDTLFDPSVSLKCSQFVSDDESDHEDSTHPKLSRQIELPRRAFLLKRRIHRQNPFRPQESTSLLPTNASD